MQQSSFLLYVRKMKSFAALFVWFGVVNCKYPQVKVEQGRLTGTIYPLKNGRTLFAFLGVPYAAPPTYKNRFKEPQHLTPWVDVWNASTFPSSCLQYDHQTYTVVGEEDCLYLNVYTPKLPKRGVSPRLDVMVYIHGGGFTFGNGQDYRPDYILKKKDAVVVTINYRLGILGFLSTGDSVVPGNNGLKDQTAALKWIRNNIAQFGGNPASVTISGCSAGGVSVHYHMMSPLSDGLFQKAISFSGSALTPWAMPRNNTEKSIQLAAYVGCAVTSTKHMIQCLRGRSAKLIVEATKNFMPWKFYPFTVFGPTVEKKSRSSFLTEDPIQILNKGRVKKIPWLISLMKNEGLYPGAELISDESLLKELDENWNEIAPHLFMYNFSVSSQEEKIKVGAAIRDFYFGINPVENSTQELVQALGDRLFYNDMIRAITLHVSRTKLSNAFCYKFNYRGEHSLTNFFSHNNVNYGTSHVDDNFYMFKYFPDIDYDETASDATMMDLLTSTVLSFIESGKPNYNNVSWVPISNNLNDNLRCLEITNPYQSPAMGEYDNKRTIKFWRNALPSEYFMDDEIFYTSQRRTV